MIRRAAMLCIFIAVVFAVASCSDNSNVPTVNNPSAITIVTPWNNTTREGVVDVVVDAADIEGIKQVELHAGDTVLGELPAEPYNFKWDTASIPDGTSTTLFARAIDIYGKATDSAPVVVKKGAVSTPKVTLTSPTTTVTIKQGDAVTFKGSATDGDSTLSDASLSWSSNLQGPFTPNALKNEKADNFQFKGLVIGDHLITLTATNSNGVTATATARVKVNENAGVYGYVPAGTYSIGQPGFVKTKVTISRSYLIAKKEMTCQQFLELMLAFNAGKVADLNKNFITKRNLELTVNKLPTPPVIPPFFALTKDSPLTATYGVYPVGYVAYFEACAMCNQLSINEKLQQVYTLLDSKGNASTNPVGDITNFKIRNIAIDWDANGYRMPTEAEFEVAARGGLVGNMYPWGDVQELGAANTMSDPAPVNPFDVYNGRGPVAGGQYLPNGYGLYDMAGNMAEITSDMVSGRVPSGYDPHVSSDNSKAPRFLIKGGSWSGFLKDSQICVRALSMSSNKPDKDGYAGTYGMRVMRYAP